jgi:hypothetical protein
MHRDPSKDRRLRLVPGSMLLLPLVRDCDQASVGQIAGGKGTWYKDVLRYAVPHNEWRLGAILVAAPKIDHLQKLRAAS